MLRNYWKTALRNLWKNRTFSFINIAGLTIGVAACLLILQYVSFQLSFDQFNEHIGDIYRVYNDRYQHGKLVQHGTITYSGIGKAMQDDYPEVVSHTRVEPIGGQVITYMDKKFQEPDAIAVDSTFLSMFDFPLLAGDRNTALKDPNDIIISEKLARKIFDYRGNDFRTLIGKTIVISRDSLPYKVTAICRNIPENSHLKFDLMLSWQTMASSWHWRESDYDFKDSDFWHYIQLKHGTNYKVFEARFAAFSKKHFQGDQVSGSDEKFYLQPLSRAHLYSDFEYEIGQTDSATVVWGLLIIALFIICIAWVNYINLSTARSIDRAKEVGIRKVAGASRGQLIRQFLAESVIINLIALVIGIGVVLLLQDSFNRMVGYDLSMSYLFRKGMSGYWISVGLTLLVLSGILISGFYPSFVLSSFKPILVLKGKFSNSGRGIFLRKALVVGQFSITVALIIGSLIVYQQMKYVSSQKLGMNIDQLVVVKGPGLTAWDSTFLSKQAGFEESVRQLASVKGVASTDRPLGNDLARVFNVHRSDGPATDNFTMRRFGVSHDFLPVYGISLLTGRNFSRNDYSLKFENLHNILLNQSAVRLFGFRNNQEALAHKIKFFGKDWDVIGVADDFHQKSLHYPVEPLIMVPFAGPDWPISIKISAAHVPETMAAIRAKYDSFFPGNLFDYSFLDESFREQYKNDELFGKVFGIFAGFAIFVACLGLLGLSLFATMQRTKEIGVRKVLGASIPNIVVLLSRDFVGLVLIAFLVASPLAWYIMHKWLLDFAYRIEISYWVFFLAGALALFIAILTIGLQAARAAAANPVKSLRSE